MKTALALDPRHTALLLVDFQEEQRTHPLYAVHDFSGVLVNARKLLDTARSSRIPIVHTAYRRDFERCPPRPFEPVNDSGRPAFSDSSGAGTEICRELNP